jgi:hypothetical protein
MCERCSVNAGCEQVQVCAPKDLLRNRMAGAVRATCVEYILRSVSQSKFDTPFNSHNAPQKIRILLTQSKSEGRKQESKIS